MNPALETPRRVVSVAALVAASTLAACLGWFISVQLELFGGDVGGTQSRSHPIEDWDSVPDSIEPFLRLRNADNSEFKQLKTRIREGWDNAQSPMLLEMARFSSHPDRVLDLLEELTGQTFKGDLNAGYDWVWANQFGAHPEYGQFKALLYRRLDGRFYEYFNDHTDGALIRLDEVRWGGVKRDGIPPLKNPKMITQANVDYLDGNDVVFGVSINGDARAYPKRILAWHEMFKDTIGGVSINGVYCTLCGSMIVYQTEHQGTHYELGTSGFLYRSNKLMYDHATESMWSTIKGEPVIGPLVGRGIKLKPLSVVTTTWDQWRQSNPGTTVLSLDTGHRRDYGEGVAYRDYFATDELMFTVPELDHRLKNKAEVLALRFGEPGAQPAAIDAEMLAGTPIFQGEYAGVSYVVLTGPAGANRVYNVGGHRFVNYNGFATVADTQGNKWSVREEGLINGGGHLLPRLAAHRAFWFGWYAAHPDTELIR